MQWFFAYNEWSTRWFEEMIKVAVISAQTHTNLEPHCLYDGKENDLTRWLSKRRVHLHSVEVPFKAALFGEAVLNANNATIYRPQQACGAFLRVLASEITTTDMYLYTDCDIMFCGNAVESLYTRSLSAVSELHSNAFFNSGVMLCDTVYMESTRKAFIQFVAERYFYHHATQSYDQTFLNQFHKTQWAHLNPVFNWRPCQGYCEEAQIVHFHGPKPGRIPSIMDGTATTVELNMRPYIERNRDAYNRYLQDFNNYLKLA